MKVTKGYISSLLRQKPGAPKVLTQPCTLMDQTGYALIFSLLLCAVSPNAAAEESYTVDTIDFPKDMPVEVGAIDFDTKGVLYLAIRRGDILTATPQADPAEFKWKHFASGFHNPCGIHIVKPGHIIISQMAELTEVIDTDNDGIADTYNALSTDFGLSGNYHETMDICPDGNGGLYLAPGTASHNGPTFTTPRGRFLDGGRLGRNYSSVEWRGWVLHWQPGKELIPVSSGYRMHNGIERSPKGDIWCGDNQGDWRSSSPVYHVTPDSFAGHPSSLVWDERFAGVENPLYLPRILLDDLWNKPAFRLPRSMMNSCAEPAFIPEDGSFGPFEGQMLIPDQSGDRIVRCMPEWVDGNYQGAATLFYNQNGLLRGNNRLAFSPDGSTLYVGQTGRGWGKLSEGLQRICYQGNHSLEVANCQLKPDGFDVTFTKPVDQPETIRIERFRYDYGYQYGGDELDKEEIKLSSFKAADGVIRIKIADGELLPNYVYRFHLNDVVATDGTPFQNLLEYTLNRLVRPQSDTQVTITEQDGKFTVKMGDELFTEYHTAGFSNPILYPIQNEAGTGMTRDWPVNPKGRDGEQQDHPHHRSLFIGHESVNGIDFWHDTRPTDGTIEHARTIETRSGEDRALIRTFNLWKDPDGKVQCTDTREMQFGLIDGVRYLDLELNIHASHGPVTFGEKKDGVIGLRTHPDLRLKPAPGKGVEEVFGHAANSEGVTGGDVWGKKADWVHYHGKIDGKDSGIAILSHPGNARSKTWWHARDYGLVAANPFGPVQSGGDGELVLPEGETFTMRYRFLFHDKKPEEADIGKQFTHYAKQPLYPRTVCLPIPEAGAEKEIAIPKNVDPRGDVLSKVTRTVDGKKAKSPELKIHGFVEGEKIYRDRDFTYSKIPDYLRGGDLLITFNNDKKRQVAAYEVTVSQPGMLHVLVDSRAEESMKWLSDQTGDLKFSPSKDTVKTSGDFTFKLFTAEVDPGVYTLGDQFGGSFYGVVGVNRD